MKAVRNCTWLADRRPTVLLESTASLISLYLVDLTYDIVCERRSQTASHLLTLLLHLMCCAQAPEIPPIRNVMGGLAITSIPRPGDKVVHHQTRVGSQAPATQQHVGGYCAIIAGPARVYQVV